ncbi:c-type cytochrome biogenesis protein CcmI [Vineibacter terrae]|uniref:C-type cytochrome biogenesis protein CcmI n=1 Tax=Vineibacter terrae TaxID=2586908 RepID=A0A5C8PNM9_9HYPH|nr:c-type cytochrome biogenesis protein CcmI [Vineibacter terrae]TXL76004.1 c-type cytochrome biogenesis protein CcmI [Vineibacter terrae]
MTLPFALAVITALVIAALLLPLLRRRFDATRRLDHDLAIYKDQLAEVERDRLAGRLSGDEAKAASTEIERRILAAAGADDAATMPVPPRRRFLPTAIAILVPVAALGIYFQTGRPELPAQPFAERPKPPAPSVADAGPMEMVRRLRERVEKDPKDVEARLALGRAQLAVGRVADAVESFRAAQQAAPDRADVLSALGEALTFESDGVVTQPARALFAAALERDPRSAGARFYLGLADAQGGDPASALRRWLDLEADSPDGAPWLETLAREIERVSRQAGIDPKSIRPDRKERKPRDAGMPQPSADDVKRLEQLPPEQREQQIRAMVDRLAERLKEAPDDVEGWRRLARARAVLGEHGKAAEAYAAADKLKPDDPEILAAWAEVRLRLDEVGTKPLSPETIAVLKRLEKVRPDNGLALFFLAQADEAAGDRPGAIARLRRLRDLMPAEAPARAAIEKRLQALEGK